MTGFSIRKIRKVTMPPPSRPRSGFSVGVPAPEVFWNVDAPADMSAPAQNARPAPVTTTARTPPSASAASRAATISCTIRDVKALSLSGRFRVIVATRSATS